MKRGETRPHKAHDRQSSRVPTVLTVGQNCLKMNQSKSVKIDDELMDEEIQYLLSSN